MSQAEELLDGLTEEQVALYTARPEEEPHIVIDENRKITVPEELKRIAVQYDHNVETVTFDCVRFWDDIDMSKMHIYINYVRADGKMGMDLVDDITVDAEDESIMHFKWTVKAHVTEASGNLSFLVCVKATDDEGNESNHWNSELCNMMHISPGLECAEHIVNAHPDIITDLLVRMDSVESYVTPEYVSEILSQRLDEHPEMVTDKISEIITPEVIQQNVVEYMESNHDEMMNKVSEIVTPEVIQQDVNDYIDANPDVITDKVHDIVTPSLVQDCVDVHFEIAPWIVEESVKKILTPEVMQQDVNDYLTENPETITDEVDKIMTPEFIQSNIDEYLENNPIESPIDPTLSKSKYAADAAIVGDLVGYTRTNILPNLAPDLFTAENLSVRKYPTGHFTVEGHYTVSSEVPEGILVVEERMQEMAEIAQAKEYDDYIMWYGMYSCYYGRNTPWDMLYGYSTNYLMNEPSTSSTSDKTYERKRRPGYKYAILIKEAVKYNAKTGEFSTAYLPCIYNYDGSVMTNVSDMIVGGWKCTYETDYLYADFDNNFSFEGKMSPATGYNLYGVQLKKDGTVQADDFDRSTFAQMDVYGSNVPCFGSEEDILRYFETGDVSTALFCPDKLKHSDVEYVINDSLVMKPGQYILSGNPMKDYPDAALTVTVDGVTYYDKGEGVTFDVANETVAKVTAILDNECRYENQTFKPMIRPASIDDDTFKPFSDNVNNRLLEVENALGYSNNNMLKVTGTDTTNGGIKFTFNKDGSVKLSGTYTGGGNTVLVGNVEIEAGTYIVTGSINEPDIRVGTYVAMGGLQNFVTTYTTNRATDLLPVYIEIYRIPIDTVVDTTIYPMVLPSYIEDRSWVPYKGSIGERLDDVDEILDNVDEQMIDLQRSIIDVDAINEAAGSPILITDSADGTLSDIKLYGRSTQDGTPTPDAPVDIVSVADDLTLSVKSFGKNLIYFDVPESSVYQGITVTRNADRSLTLNGTVTGSSFIVGVLNYKLNKGIYTLSGVDKLPYSDHSYLYVRARDTGDWFCCENSGTKEVSFELTSDREVDILFGAEVGETLNGTIYPMLRYTEITDSTYEPHKEPYTIAIPLGEPLRSMGDVKDELTCVDGKYGVIRRVGSVKYDASDLLWTNTYYNNVVYFYIAKPFDILDRNTYNDIPIISDKFRYQKYIGNYDSTEYVGAITVAASNREVWFGFPTGTTIEQAQSIGEIQIVYPLAQEKFNPFPDEYQELFHNIPTYNSTTTLIAVDNTDMKVEYYSNSSVGKRLAKTNDEMKAEHRELHAVIESTVGYTRKNLLRNMSSGGVNGNLIIAIDDETDEVIIDGTCTEDFTHIINDAITLEAGTYILSGNPILDNYDTRMVIFIDGEYYEEFGRGVEFTLTSKQTGMVYLIVDNAYTYNHTIYRPMIRRAEIIDDTYEPYVDDVDTRLTEAEGSISSINSTLNNSVNTRLTEAEGSISSINSTLNNSVNTRLTAAEGSISSINSTLNNSVAKYQNFTIAGSGDSATITLSAGDAALISVRICSGPGCHALLYAYFIGSSGSAPVYSTFATEGFSSYFSVSQSFSTSGAPKGTITITASSGAVGKAIVSVLYM